MIFRHLSSADIETTRLTNCLATKILGVVVELFRVFFGISRPSLEGRDVYFSWVIRLLNAASTCGFVVEARPQWKSRGCASRCRAFIEYDRHMNRNSNHRHWNIFPWLFVLLHGRYRTYRDMFDLKHWANRCIPPCVLLVHR